MPSGMPGRMEGSTAVFRRAVTALRGTITALLRPVATGLLWPVTGRIAGLLALYADDDAAAGIHAQHAGRHIGGTKLTGPFAFLALRAAGPMTIERLGKDRRIGMHRITFLFEIGKLPCILCSGAEGGSGASGLFLRRKRPPKRKRKAPGRSDEIGNALRCMMKDCVRPARRDCPCGRGGAAAQRTPRQPAAAARR